MATSIVLNGATWFRPVCAFHRGVALAARWTAYDPAGGGAGGTAGVAELPPRRKLRRLRRPGAAELPDDLRLVRAAPGTWAERWTDITAEARRCGATYAVKVGDEREVLFGVSVLALRPGIDPARLLAPFDRSPKYLELSVAGLRWARFVVLATRGRADRFEIQLVDGHSEELEDPDEAIEVAAARLLGAGTFRDNPAFTPPEPAG